jgi:chorismate synthase
VRARKYLPATIEHSAVRCADPEMSEPMATAVERARAAGDSVGGVVEIRAGGVPAGLGDPVFAKLDALLASAFMGIGAVKGVEIGDGFELARLRGSEANDAMSEHGFASNHAGGILGGISTGAEIVARLAVKPTPSIRLPQRTIDTSGRPQVVSVAGRHDACIAPRLVPVAEAMAALVLMDAVLAQRAWGQPLAPSPP